MVRFSGQDKPFDASSIIRGITLSLATTILAAASASADVIRLANGEEIRGKVERRTASEVVVRSGQGALHLAAAEVVEIVEEAEEAPPPRREPERAPEAAPATASASAAPAPAAPAAPPATANTPAPRRQASARSAPAVTADARVAAQVRDALQRMSRARAALQEAQRAVEKAAEEQAPPEGRTPAQAAAARAYDAADAAYAAAVAAAEQACALPGGGSVATALLAGTPADSPDAGALAGLVARYGGEAGGAALADLCLERGAGALGDDLIAALGAAPGPRPLDAIRRLVAEAKDRGVRAALVRALDPRGRPGAALALARWLGHEDSEVASAAAAAFQLASVADIADSSGVRDALVALAGSGRADRRPLALAALARLPQSLCLDIFVRDASDADPAVSAPAVETLAAISNDQLDVTDLLCRLVDAPRTPRETRLAAIAALGRRKSKRGLPHLILTLRREELKVAAAHALSEATGEELPPSFAAWKSWYLDWNPAGSELLAADERAAAEAEQAAASGEAPPSATTPAAVTGAASSGR